MFLQLLVDNTSLFSGSSIIDLIIRFGVNLLVVAFVVLKVYFPSTRHKEYVFTYFIISTAVFMLSFLLVSLKIELGVALGLFAIFGIIRYRTSTVPIREMTYLFFLIALSVANAVTTSVAMLPQLLVANVVLALMVFIMEKVWMRGREHRKTILYEKIELIRPERRQDLIRDLSERTGLSIHRVEIGKIDFLKDVASIIVYFDKELSNANLSDFEVGEDQSAMD
jgi:uncharacterized membrane protein